MSANPKLYEKITLPGVRTQQNVPGTKTYKGFSTISEDATSFALYDLALIKQDILNHFHIRQGEKLNDPTFGTVIWDVIFEPLTEELKQLVAKNVEDIINYDPRVRADQVIITQYESGLQIECRLTYLPYYIQESIQLKFDQANGLVN
jgi:phage baseplate assembly protein W